MKYKKKLNIKYYFIRDTFYTNISDILEIFTLWNHT